MNPCAIHQCTYPCLEETRREAVAFPKPRRITSSHDQPISPLRWQFGNQTEMNDLKAGAEVLDIIMTKDDYGVQQHNTQIAWSSSPPYFCGSPPTRVANPLIKDERFREENLAPFSQASVRQVGLVRSSSGNKPGLRIEGFNCLNRDGRNCGIRAWA